MEGRSEMWRDDVPKYFKKLRKGKWRGGGGKPAGLGRDMKITKHYK